MSQDVEFGDFSIEKVDRRAIVALLVGVSLGIIFWSVLILFITG